MTKSESMTNVEARSKTLAHSSVVIPPKPRELGMITPLSSANPKPAQLFERHLTFDVGRRGDRAVDKSRAAISEQNARNCAKFADSHRAYGEVDVFLRDEIKQSRELRRC